VDLMENGDSAILIQGHLYLCHCGCCKNRRSR
jgi:hypothetical protein